MDTLVLNKLPHIVSLHGYVNLVRKKTSKRPKSNKQTSEKQSKFDPAGFQRSSSVIFSNYKETNCDNLNTNTINFSYDFETNIERDWQLVAVVMSRFFALIFCTVVVVSTVVILAFIWYQSNIEFQNAIGQLREEWQAVTYFSNAE